ncbi:hypothetical protein N7466_007303 [Penicillium verhagenii]|uniref:uncharacterized protein n=1 Tax=Penicillium verhagenii TaxID=1562060 RepID=UPI0025453EB8|nr:uncharacterized protein N7466_007303 [Penicillium verhagenii]KAJ5928347.1 hypothetical protein N7466_007303 [Penicillium verhagenii]
MVKPDGVWEQGLIKGVTSKYPSGTKLIGAAKEEFQQQTSRELKDVADNSTFEMTLDSDGSSAYYSQQLLNYLSTINFNEQVLDWGTSLFGLFPQNITYQVR